MARYLLKRIFYMILTLFIVATVTFFLMKLMPGSPYANEAKMTLTQRHIMDEQYGLNKPVWQQYLIYIGGMLHGDFGVPDVLPHVRCGLLLPSAGCQES